MKKKNLKKLVRELDQEVEDLLARDLSVRDESVFRQVALVNARNVALRRVAVLEQQCKATTPVLHEAAERVKQSDAVLAAHWANVGAFVERANRIEAAAEKMREYLLIGGGAEAEVQAVVLAYDEAKGPGRIATSPSVAPVTAPSEEPYDRNVTDHPAFVCGPR